MHSLQCSIPDNSVLSRILLLGSHSNLCIFPCGHWSRFSKCIYYVKYYALDCELFKFKNGLLISVAHLTVFSTMGAESLNKQWTESPWAPFSYWKRKTWSIAVPSKVPEPDFRLSHGHSLCGYLASLGVSGQHSCPQQCHWNWTVLWKHWDVKLASHCPWGFRVALRWVGSTANRAAAALAWRDKGEAWRETGKRAHEPCASLTCGLLSVWQQVPLRDFATTGTSKSLYPIK